MNTATKKTWKAMENIFRVLGFALAISMILGTIFFGFDSCMAEDHRHSEEMRRMRLAQDQCNDFMIQIEAE